ncbi:hypothetical protein OUZ56_016524, partial [Daphnia magna]
SLNGVFKAGRRGLLVEQDGHVREGLLEKMKEGHGMSNLGLPWAEFSIQRLRALSSGVGPDRLPISWSRPNWRSRMKSQSVFHVSGPGSVPPSSSQGR